MNTETSYAQVMRVKATRGLGGSHSEMGSYRHNPITEEEEFHPWMGLGTFGDSVKESEALQLVDAKTGQPMYLDQLKHGMIHDHLPVIISVDGKRISTPSFDDQIEMAKMEKLGLKFEIVRQYSRL